MLESSLKNKIKRLIESRGGFWSAVKGGEYSKPGDTDIIACYLGRYVAIEGKAATGKPSYDQEDCREWIRDAWGIHIYSYNLETVEKVLDGIKMDLDEEVRYTIAKDPEGFDGIEDVAVGYIAMGIRDPRDIRSCIDSGITPAEAWELKYG